MTMVFCKGCGKEIHESAPTCPHCGAPQFTGGSSQNGADKGFIEYATMPLKRYAEFGGRSRRKEFWFFILGYMLVLVALGILRAVSDTLGGILAAIFYLGIMVPYIAVFVRRLHDTDRSGWWILVPIANIVFVCMEGQRGANRFGPDPKA